MSKKFLSVLHCPRHNFYGVAIEDEEGNGHRITHSKCCGFWNTIQRWEMGDSCDELVSQDKDEIRWLLEALEWALIDIADGCALDGSEIPIHDCELLSNPEKGACDFHTHWTNALWAYLHIKHNE